MNNQHTTIDALAALLRAFIQDELTVEQAKAKAESQFTQVTADELALAEQALVAEGLSDTQVYGKIDGFLEIFAAVLQAPDLHLAAWHPVHTYGLETDAIEQVLKQAEHLSRDKFVPNQWAEVMDKLTQFGIHLSRKQNQLYPAFERQHFDRPSKIMWSLDDAVKTGIRTAYDGLKTGDSAVFFIKYDEMTALLHDLIEKERVVLYPAAMEMIPTKEFLTMRQGDDEIGFCLIDPPPAAPTPDAKSALSHAPNTAQPEGFASELQGLLQKYGMVHPDTALDVRQGKLTLEQINLIFRHLPVDLSFVDENELVRFYSDTKHRVFPRSPGVIGRDVNNCHPRESAHMVREIIEEFRTGRQDEAEFWLEMGGKFIYILYTAVRDDTGRFKGVLEMMQDATHLRSLEGSNRLISWKPSGGASTPAPHSTDTPASAFGLTPTMRIGDLISKYPALRGYLPQISPKYKKLANPVIFNMMAGVATLDMVAERGGLSAESLIALISAWLKTQQTQPNVKGE